MLTFILFCVTLEVVFCQFQDHVDLQQISEIMFRNEKYNVLKPTIHVMRDHFKDFIQKRNSNFPSNRVFLDKNGFRHFWKGMEFIKPDNLRKSDLSEPNTKVIKENTYTSSSTDKKVSVDNDNRTNSNLINSNRVKVKDKPKRKKRILEDVYVPAKPNLREGSVVVKTTFFCPFFGIIKMSTHLDSFEEDKTNSTTK